MSITTTERTTATTLLQQMLTEFGRDGHGGEFEDREHPLIDEVRAFLAGTPYAVRTKPARAWRIYIAGPMTGLPDLNVHAFNAAAIELRTQGWHVENPADHGVISGAEWADYLAYDLTRLGTCGAIYLLPGWEKSKGARLEVHIAKTLALEIVLHPHAISPAPFTDTELLDFVEAHKVNVENEWAGAWEAFVYEDTPSPITMEDGDTARAAIASAKQKHEQLIGAAA